MIINMIACWGRSGKAMGAHELAGAPDND